MPTPRSGESRSDFVERCIPIVIDEGTAEGGEQAAAICNSMWRRSKDMGAIFAIDNFVSTVMGDPFRLLPFANLQRLNGDEFDITPEMARKFRLPGFHPPIKRGGHGDDAPAIGHIVDLEVREDGLYAVPEWTEEGQRVIERGDFRYHSPELIWEGEQLEDVINGPIEGPIVVGDALLHVPALGEAAAFYTATIDNVNSNRGADMAEENQAITPVPTPVWEKMWSFFTDGGGQEPDPPPQRDDVEDFAAIKAEAEKYQAELTEAQERIEEFEAERQRMEAEKKHAERVSHFAAEFEETVVADDDELHELLADVEDEEKAEALVRKFKALAEQAKHADLEEELGASGDNVNGKDAADAAIKAYAAEHDLSYMDAFAAIQRKRPELLVGG